MLASYSEADAPRAQVFARGTTITATGDTRTAISEDSKPVITMHIRPNDTLQSIANHFGISAEAIAYSNGITDPNIAARVGQEIQIPPGEGALYKVKEGDTVESVAGQFKVEPRAILDYNRLYFEPEHFGVGKQIFVPGATVPGLVYVVASPREQVRPPSVLSRPVQAASGGSGAFLMPVNGRITQHFWAFHTGVDVATSYGSGVNSSDAGTVVATGWIAVGGLHIRVQHADGYETGYYHLGAIFVAPGQKVARGQVVGTVGMTGVTTGPHVHWELKRNGAFVNPLAHTVR